MSFSQQRCLPFAIEKQRLAHDNEGHSSVQPVAVVDLSFTDVASMDASHYLAAVVGQASQLPEYFVADDELTVKRLIPPHKKQKENESGKSALNCRRAEESSPIDGSAASMQYLMSHRTCLLPPPSPRYIPQNAFWVDKTLADFSELRSHLERCRLQGVGGKKTQRLPLPPMKDRSGWHAFCVGQAEAKGNVGSYYDEGEQDDEDGGEEENDDEEDGEDDGNKELVHDKNVTTTTQSCRSELPPTGYEPSVQLVLQMDQVLVRRVLSHLTFYVEEGWSPCSTQRAAWLYALLARLERPIHRDDAAMLYNLLKILTQVRSKLEFEKTDHQKCDSSKTSNTCNRDDLARLNLLIIIIGIYLEQGDASILI
jgi:survival of motor neuron protein-interacting protein 1